MTATFATSRKARLSGLFLLYAAQGAPEGLLYVAVPAWLGANGVPAEAVAGYIAVILLPWSLKLFNGVLMDRITFLPMGRRRPWLIGAQTVLVLTLLGFGARAPEGADLAWITAAGFLVNLSAAFQDVAIDGMAIDTVPEDERARANGVMWGGKTLGIGGASVATGYIIAAEGFAAAALATAAFVALVMLVPLLWRERPGERLLPWSAGEASTEARTRQLTSWAPILRDLIAALIRPQSMLLALGIFVALIGYGLDTAFGPLLAVQDLEWEQERYGALAGASNLAGGLFGVFAAGVIADRLGPGRALIITLVGVALLQGGMGATSHLWSAPWVFSGYTILYSLLFVMMSVCIYAQAMAASAPSVAATQFSVFMAILNLGTSFGAGRLDVIKPAFGYEGAFLAAAAAALAGAVLFALSSRLSARAPAR